MKIFLLLVALGLVAGNANKRKLSVYGNVDWDQTYKTFLPFAGFQPHLLSSTHNYLPALRADYLYTPLHHFNNIANPGYFRHDLDNSWKLREILHNPVVVVMKSKDKAEGLDAYFLENGVSSLIDNPHTRYIHDKLKKDADKTAMYIFNPNTWNNSPIYKNLKDLPLNKCEVAKGIKFVKFVNTFNNKLPFVYIHENDNKFDFDFDGLMKLGNLDINDEKIY